MTRRQQMFLRDQRNRDQRRLDMEERYQSIKQRDLARIVRHRARKAESMARSLAQPQSRKATL